jgi:putative oxidoreductase
MNRLFNWAGHAWLALPLRWYLGCVFVFACAHKIAHPESFAVDIATYGILPLSLVNIMAITLPWMELAAGIMLILGLRARAAALMVFGMMVMFTVALAIALGQGLDLSCGCFASQGAQGEDPISAKTVFRDTVWLVLSLYVVFFDGNAIGIDRLLARRRQVRA